MSNKKGFDLKSFIFLFSLVFSGHLLAKEEMSSSFLQLFNKGDRHDVKGYLLKNMSHSRIQTYGIEAHVGAFLNLQNTHGKLTLLDVLSEENNNERLLVQSENNQLTFTLIINREAQKPYGMNYFILRDSPARGDVKVRLSHKKIANELSIFMERLRKKDAFSGVVLVAKKEEIIFNQAVGFANKEWRVKNTLDTRFALGSINKMFTALAALKLVEQGKIKLDDKLVDYVDRSWLPEGEVDQITVRHLMTHTSGLGNFFNDEFNDSNKELYRDLESYKPLIAGAPLNFSPGSRNRYSNSGMLMLGLVIEKASGLSYYDFVQKYIYDRANMADSGSFELDSTTPKLATGYLKRMHSDNWVKSTYTRAVKGSPAGGGFSTIQDLHRFALALTNYKLLNKELTEQAYSEKTAYNSAKWYGYGFSVGGQPDNRIVGHGGAYLGVDARLDIHLDTGYVVVILANQSNVVSPVRRKINELLANADY
ncbi:serine hydrolase domain-containing protein [Pseudoalteromonas umbrosa]|uniref:serine hydrolase domain-containing protein n=1 Tax=Pseudoalteromonas umbrosa TaxID=3048489 RepID=UPI0024C46C19|nr:serine hydrolase domain-containing protein [Pseudoalteromonas sp. B95]MDK1285769.1 serine hydrolase domain-containing protein [Pseudoalteromonas sp. B95]